MVKVALAANHEIDAIWPQISEGLQKACDATGGSIAVSELWHMCRSGNAFLMVALTDKIEMASVWRFETWPSGVVFKCVGLWGQNMDAWLSQAQELAIKSAKDGGATRIITEGRKGWERIFPQSRVLSQNYEVTF